MQLFSLLTLGCGLVLLPLLSWPQSGPKPPAGGRYMGAGACKGCHNDAEKGGKAYDHWAGTPHAKAYETLATAKAKELGKKVGIDDPQKSDKCLKCHVTAFGAAKNEVMVSFKTEHGVQCESCHGPGENHKKKRFAEATQGQPPSPITPDEIQVGRNADMCRKCHNEESPSYKPFCLKERMEKIEHLDPRKKRSEEELKKLRATDAADCKVCKPGDGKDEKKDEKKEGGGK